MNTCRSNTVRFCAAMLIVIAISGGIAYWCAFTSMTIYDDEGTLMQPVRQFHAGEILYNQVISIYGPVFFIYESIPHMLTGVPVSHDSARLLTAVLRVVSGLVFFILIYRITGSLVLSLAAHWSAFRALAFMGVETGHPQEVCILLLLAVPLVITARRPLAFIACGFLCSAMALSKVNLGIFAVASLAVVLSMSLPRGRVQRALSFAIALAAVALPFALMKARLDQTWIRLALLASFSIAAAVVSARTNSIVPVRWRDVALGLLGGVIGAALITSFVLVHGTTLGAMINSLVILPSTTFPQSVNMPSHIPRRMVAWGAVNLACAWMASRERLPSTLIALMKLALGGLLVYFVARDQFAELLGPVTPRLFAKLLGPVTPMLWLVAAPGGRPTPGGGLLRPLLSVLSTITVLYIFPVARGWQTAFASVLMVACAALCVWDTLPFLVSIIPAPILRFVPAGVVTLVSFSMLFSASSVHSTFRSREPLGFPGAAHLRLDPSLTSTFRRLHEEAKSCSVLATLPGLPSLNLLTGAPAPKGVRGGPWMLWLNDAAQTEVVREIDALPRPCAIYYPKAVDAWIGGQQLAPKPLVKYIMNDLPLKFESNGYRFMAKGSTAIGALGMGQPVDASATAVRTRLTITTP